MEGNFLKMIKVIDVKPTAKTFLRSGERSRCLLLPILFSIVLEASTGAIRQEEEIKVIQIGKKIVNSLF
jgi:hypothetical protein